jgi:hypothetical protein
MTRLHQLVGTQLSDDMQLIFLDLVDRFTPTHLRIAQYFQQ